MKPTTSSSISRLSSNDPTASQRFSRADLIRILHITSRQLNAWQRAELLPAAEIYSFVDLQQAKKIRDLCLQKLRPAAIQRSLVAMRKVAGLANPLMEAATLVEGSRITFRHQGGTLEPETGQLRLDFDGNQPKAPVIAKVARNGKPDSSGRSLAGKRAQTADEVSEIFACGISLEENPETQMEAIACYQRVLEIEPAHAASHINLGTIYYNRQLFQEAELHYRSAVEADPRYALAYFDLGNVLDETGRIGEAIAAYKTAVTLAPGYADAHYNLALAYEKTRQPRKAMTHWRAYVKLDRVGPWATHARGQIRKILMAGGLQVVR